MTVTWWSRGGHVTFVLERSRTKSFVRKLVHLSRDLSRDMSRDCHMVVTWYPRDVLEHSTRFYNKKLRSKVFTESAGVDLFCTLRAQRAAARSWVSPSMIIPP